MKWAIAISIIVIMWTLVNVSNAQDTLNKIIEQAQAQKELSQKVEQLQNLTGVLCATAYMNTCKKKLEILSMDAELVATFKLLRSKNVLVVLYSIAGGFNWGNYVDGGTVYIWAGHSVPEIRKFLGLQDFFPADLLDMEFAIEKPNL